MVKVSWLILGVSSIMLLLALTGTAAMAFTPAEDSGRPEEPLPPQLAFAMETAPGHQPQMPCSEEMAGMGGAAANGGATDGTAANGAGDGIDHAAHHRAPGEAGGTAKPLTDQEIGYLVDQLKLSLDQIAALLQDLGEV